MHGFVLEDGCNANYCINQDKAKLVPFWTRTVHNSKNLQLRSRNRWTVLVDTLGSDDQITETKNPPPAGPLCGIL